MIKNIYTTNRPHIPADIKRKIKVEASHECTVKNCNEYEYLEIHHIDENRDNNNFDNLILLCVKHHKMAHAKRIDRKSLKEYKQLLNIQIEPIQRTEEEIKEGRDIENLKSILYVMPLNIIYEMIDDLPRYLKDCQIHFFDSFNKRISNQDFHIYNRELYTLLTNIQLYWSRCISSGISYRHESEDIHIFSNFGDASLDKKQQIEWDNILDARYSLKNDLDNFIDIIRNNYLSINIEEINKSGIQEYKKNYSSQ
jgi:hypothetical protein